MNWERMVEKLMEPFPARLRLKATYAYIAYQGSQTPGNFAKSQNKAFAFCPWRDVMPY